MSRATAAPSAAAGALVVALTPVPVPGGAHPGGLALAQRHQQRPRGHPRADARARLRRGGGRRRVRPRRCHVALVLRGRVGTRRPQHRAGGADPGHLRRSRPRRRRRDELLPRRRHRGPGPTSRLRRQPRPRRHRYRRRGGRPAGRQRGAGRPQRQGPGLRGDHRGGPGLQPSGPAGRRSVPEWRQRHAAQRHPAHRQDARGRQQGPGRCRVRRQQPASDADPHAAWAPSRCSCSSWSGWPGVPIATSTRRCSSGPWWSFWRWVSGS